MVAWYCAFFVSGRVDDGYRCGLQVQHLVNLGTHFVASRFRDGQNQHGSLAHILHSCKTFSEHVKQRLLNMCLLILFA